MDAMSEELHEAKRKALDVAKKYQKTKEDLAKLSAMAPSSSGPNTADATMTTITLIPSTGSAPSRPKRIVGGGFNLSSVPLPLTS